MQLPCGEKCVDWAIRLLESGHESQSAYRLAAKLRPHNHFELASLRDQVLTELNLADTADVVAICSYVAEILANSNENTLDAVLTEIKDIYLSNDHEPIEIYDFYLLYFARADLKNRNSNTIGRTQLVITSNESQMTEYASSSLNTGDPRDNNVMHAKPGLRVV